MDRAIRVLLADDHPLIRAGIRTTLLAECDVNLVGEAATADQARQMCLELRPDVLLLDVQMPGPPATQTVSFLRAECPDVLIVILTAYDSDTYVRGLISAGAAGYVLKDEAPQVVVRAIRTVMQGDTWFSPRVAEKLARLQTHETSTVDQSAFTEREAQVLRLLAQGKSNLTMAKELYLSEPTVRFHLRSIYQKIGVHSRTQAALWAAKHGLANEEEGHLSEPGKDYRKR